MDEELHSLLVGVMVTAGLPADSSEEIAFHLALHYPEHAQALLAYRPPTPADLADDISEPIESSPREEPS